LANIDAIQDKTQNEIGIDAKILISKQDKEFNLNHWKVGKPRKCKLNQVQKIIKSLTDDQREVLFYKYFQTSDYCHPVAH